MFAIKKLAASSALAKAKTVAVAKTPSPAKTPTPAKPAPKATQVLRLAPVTKLFTTGLKNIAIAAQTDPAITAAARGVPLPASSGTKYDASIKNAKGQRSVDRTDALSNANPADLVADAKKMLGANSGLEAKALAKLSPADRARCEKVKAQLGDQAIAKAVLQDWLLQSTLGGHGAMPTQDGLKNILSCNRSNLVGSAKNKDGQDLLCAFEKIATQPLAAGIDRAELLSNVIRETANPATQHQESRNSCAITTTTIKLALENPAEYARLVGGLATPGGSVKLANGDTVRRAGDWQVADGGRSLSGKLIYPALMSYANPGYNNTKDEAKYLGAFGYEGTGPGNWKKVTEAVFNRGVDEALVFSWNADEIVSKLASETAAGRPTPVSFTWGGSRHVCLVTGVKDGRVQFVNPYGEFNSLSISDFKKSCGAVMFERSGNIFKQIFDDTNPAKALGNGLANLDRGVQELNPIKIAGGLVQAIGGGVIGGVVATGGKYIEKGGDWVMDQGKKLWDKGGVLGKVGGGAVIGVGAVVKGIGWGIKKVGNAVSFAYDKVGAGIAWVGDKVWQAGGKVVKAVAGAAKAVAGAAKAVGGAVVGAAKAVGGAVAGAAKAVGGAVKGAAKAVGNTVKKIFSGW